MKVNNQIIKFIKNILFVCLFFGLNNRYCYSEQNDSICFEKNALTFFKDSIIPKFYKYNNTKIIFDGYVDSSMTLIVYSCFIKYPITDNGLKKACDDYKKELVHEKRKPIFITSGKIFFKGKNLFQFKRKRFLKIFQALKIENYIYVWIRTYSNKPKQVVTETKDFFIKMNLEGKVIDWCSGFH